ncbi:RDD family protein [uncultured Clostridium sp.]|uniref:RDD family protein n=1 Tax=uncultured Clostridium sp. TaxID=59620 RepID=UPI0025E41A8B|nr:RDD family protein [uncultured Clostridium sp.]
MDKDNLKENETEEKNSIDFSKESEENTNSELQDLIEGQEENSLETDSKSSLAKGIFANLLDQLIVLAGSSLILLITDLIMHTFGYQFIRETGVLVSAVMVVYFIINCLYTQLMERTKLKNTIAKRILNL